MRAPAFSQARLADQIADATARGQADVGEQSGRARKPLVMHVFPSFAVGGAQVRFAALANRFRARWRHVVVPLDGNGACAARIGPQVPFTLLDPPAPATAAARPGWRAICGTSRRCCGGCGRMCW
jgi:hypothetical protein